ncbi:MAG TPA: hypothetical protein VIH88_13725 [Candidatus Acidoferrales bacterium]
MPDLKGFYDDMDFLSDRLSTQVRAIGLALLGVTWAILTTRPIVFQNVAPLFWQWIFRVQALAVLSLACDFLQYMFGYIEADRLRRKLEANSKHHKELDYDYSSLFYRARTAFFWLKQILVATAVIVFISLLIPYLFLNAPGGPTVVPPIH